MLSQFISQLPIYLLTLPAALLALSLHETAHGYVALKLGDPTARNFGRLSLNPLKHIDIIGFVCMVLFHFGWAKPVPINTRNFKNPRRDMALTGLAGPMSNLILALINALLVRFCVFLSGHFFSADLQLLPQYFSGLSDVAPSIGFTMFSILSVIVYLGVIINIGYAVFNLIPVPPLDGSRIFYVFLPPRWYFGVMKYEQIIALVLLVLLWTGLLSSPLNFAINGLTDLLFRLTGMGSGTEASATFYGMYHYVVLNLLKL